MPQPIVSDICSVDGCDRPRAEKSNGTRRAMCPGHTSRRRHRSRLSDDVPIKDYAHTAGGGHLSSYGYWLIAGAGHPLAFANGDVLEHRALMYDHVGPGEHSCRWCSRTVDWGIKFPADGALVVDHLDGDRLNNDLTNLVISCQPCNSSRAGAGNPIDWMPDEQTT